MFASDAYFQRSALPTLILQREAVTAKLPEVASDTMIHLCPFAVEFGLRGQGPNPRKERPVRCLLVPFPRGFFCRTSDVTSVIPATGSTLTFASGAAALGDNIEIISISTTLYLVRAITSAAGGITIA